MAAGDIVVFLGPSLSIDAARRVLPARYLGPARCGDILKARRLSPRAIAVIDGVFAHTAAVWHKEILLALDEGIPVFGASSMGALRAAELAPFGMIGIGRIFEAYRDGVYTDDDEVALLHGPAESGYRELSEAMVNIRATMANAMCCGVVSQNAGERVIRCAKELFYQQRTFDAAISRTWPNERDRKDRALNDRDGRDQSLNLDRSGRLSSRPEARHRLRRFIANGGYINQKRLDALELLTHLADRAAWRPLARIPAHRTTFILKLHHDVMCEPFAAPSDDLPLDEHVAREARTLGRLYPLLCRLARLMAVVHGLGEKLSSGTRDPGNEEQRTSNLQSPMSQTVDVGTLDVGNWQLEIGARHSRRRTTWESGLDDEGRERFVQRMDRLRAVVTDYVGRQGARRARRTRQRCLLDMLRLDDAYGRLREDCRPQECDEGSVSNVAEARRMEIALYLRIAILWAIAEERLDREQVEAAAPLQALSDEFRRKRGLHRRTGTLAWCRNHNLDRRGYERLVALDARLSMVTGGCQAYATGLPFVTDAVCHLLDAIRVSGLYGRLERRVSRTDTPMHRAVRDKHSGSAKRS